MSDTVPSEFYRGHDQQHPLTASSQSELSQDPCHSLTSSSNTHDQSELSLDPYLCRGVSCSLESDVSVASTQTNDSDDSNSPHSMQMSNGVPFKHQARTPLDDSLGVPSQSNCRHSLDQFPGINESQPHQDDQTHSVESLQCSERPLTTPTKQPCGREAYYTPTKNNICSNRNHMAYFRPSSIHKDNLDSVIEQHPMKMNGVARRRPQSSNNIRVVKRREAFRRLSAPSNSDPPDENHQVCALKDTNQNSDQSQEQHRQLTFPDKRNGCTPCGAMVTVHNTISCKNEPTENENSQLGTSDDGEQSASSNKITDNQFENCRTLSKSLGSLTNTPKEEVSSQTSKRSMLSVIKSTLIRPKVITSELVWTEKVERIQKYIYSKKLQGDAITCSPKLEVDGMGYPNPKLLLHIYPYGIEEDENKDITMEVKIELQKKVRLPSKSLLELKVTIESKDGTHNTLLVQEDIRLTFFYLKKIISHDLLKKLKSADITIRVHAKLVLPQTT